MASVPAIAAGRVTAQAGCLNWLLGCALCPFLPQRKSFISVQDYYFDHRFLFQTFGTFEVRYQHCDLLERSVCKRARWYLGPVQADKTLRGCEMQTAGQVPFSSPRHLQVDSSDGISKSATTINKTNQYKCMFLMEGQKRGDTNSSL